MQTEEIVSELLKQAEKFMQVHETDSVTLIVSPETFYKLSPALSCIEHDKNYSSGHLGRHYVRSDKFVKGTDKALVFKPAAFDDFVEPVRREQLCL